MTTKRIIRVNELIRREIGLVLFRLVTEDGFDMASITVTHVITSPDLRRARVFVSVRDHADQRESFLNIIRGHRAEIQAEINRNLKLKYTPRLTFELDSSLEQGDRILTLLAEIEPDSGGEVPVDGDSHA